MDMTRHISRIVALGLLLAILSIATPHKADAAPECGSGARIGRNGGSARGCVEETDSGGGGSSSGSGEGAAEAAWNRWCSHFAPYEPGATATPGNRATLSAQQKQEYIDGGVTVRGEPVSPDEDYVTFTVTCTIGGFTRIVNEVSAAGDLPGVDPIVLRDTAAARIEPPVPSPGLSPQGDSEIIGIVHVPVWFWFEGSWEPIIETEAQGGVTVTVTATPRRLTFNPGDGNPPAACEGPGVVWAPGMSDDLTNCSYTYKSSSADQPNEEYQASVVANWIFTWTLNGVDQGEFGDIDTTTEFTYQVGEIQAIERGALAVCC